MRFILSRILIRLTEKRDLTRARLSEVEGLLSRTPEIIEVDSYEPEPTVFGSEYEVDMYNSGAWTPAYYGKVERKNTDFCELEHERDDLQTKFNRLEYWIDFFEQVLN